MAKTIPNPNMKISQISNTVGGNISTPQQYFPGVKLLNSNANVFNAAKVGMMTAKRTGGKRVKRLPQAVVNDQTRLFRNIASGNVKVLPGQSTFQA